MKRTALLLAMLSVPAISHADSGLDLAWRNCRADGGTRFHGFACDTNTAETVGIAFGSFRASTDHPHFVGIEAVVDIVAADPVLPDWWQFFNTGACRRTALTLSANFTGVPHFACEDPYLNPVGGIAAYQTSSTVPPNPYPGNDRARLKLAFAIANERPIEAERDYYAFTLRIDGTRTSDEGSCGGCAVPVCLALTSIKVAENTGQFENITRPVIDNKIGWQCGLGGGAGGVCSAPSVPCATVAGNPTWGRIKALYR